MEKESVSVKVKSSQITTVKTLIMTTLTHNTLNYNKQIKLADVGVLYLPIQVRFWCENLIKNSAKVSITLKINLPVGKHYI